MQLIGNTQFSLTHVDCRAVILYTGWAKNTGPV